MGEFLLANHPLDCPVCDRGGECELQEMIFDWGDVEERFRERKNAEPEKFLSPIVANDPQRCIVCKRCTRVCDEWMGEDAIEAGNRGVNTVIGTYGGWLGCTQCGNCIEVCPTGTLLDGVYRHETRPWELDQTVSTDPYGSDGMQISIGARAGEVHRVVARDRYVNGLNGEFLDVKARFAHGFINHADRIKTPLIRYKKGGKLIPATWDEAVTLVAKKFKEAAKVGVISSPRLTNESIFTLARFAREVVKGDMAVSDNYDLAPLFNNLSVPLATHKDIRKAKTIVLLGGEPEEEQSFTAKQVRQAVRNGGAKLIVVNAVPIRLSSIATQFLHINKCSYDAVVLAMIEGPSDALAKKAGVAKSDLDAMVSTIKATEGDVVVMFGASLAGAAQAAVAAAASKLGGEKSRVLLQPLPLHNNSVGANDMAPSRKPAGDVISESSALLIGGSLPESVAETLSGKEFIVVQEMFETETTRHADVVFPAASFAEVDGTYTNNTGFVQRVRQSIEPQHQSKADWVITSMIAKAMGCDFGYNMAATNCFMQLAEATPAYNGLRYPHLKDESRPVQAKYKVGAGTDFARAIEGVKAAVSALPDSGEKISETPRVGHKLHRVTTMTGKTEQFHLLAAGNPKPDNLLVSPLVQFNLDGSRRESAVAVAAADRE